MDNAVFNALKEWLIIKMKENLITVSKTEERYSAGSPIEALRFMMEIFDLTPNELCLGDFTTAEGYTDMVQVLDHIERNYPAAIAKAFRDGAEVYYFPDEASV
tara:strand:- start:54 stop:362 length:309 start_codon:yes stop_codon:yes gene_type:complete